MSATLPQLVAAYLQWSGLRDTLTGPARRNFGRWVTESRPELIRPYAGRMAEFAVQCEEVKRLCSEPAPERGIGLETLKAFTKELVAIYLALPEKDKGTFEEFLDIVRRDCQSRRALEAYVQKRTSTKTP